jgi:hypothetical protein
MWANTVSWEGYGIKVVMTNIYCSTAPVSSGEDLKTISRILLADQLVSWLRFECIY